VTAAPAGTYQRGAEAIGSWEGCFYEGIAPLVDNATGTEIAASPSGPGNADFNVQTVCTFVNNKKLFALT
jgi:hypothetical protein